MIRWFKKFAALCVVALAACGGGNDSPTVSSPTVVEIVKTDPQFSVLVEALTAAGLVDTLAAPGAYTVFAPTNDAFTKLLAELKTDKATLLANKPLLTKVLTYHVLPGKYPQFSFASGKPNKTLLAGNFFWIDQAGFNLTILDTSNRKATITKTDIDASNGVVHVVSSVLLPTGKTIVDTAVGSAPEFTILVEAVAAAGLVDTLQGPGPFTVFAPTNAAFAAALAELNTDKATLFANKALLAKILKYHVVADALRKADIPLTVDPTKAMDIKTVETETFTVSGSFAITDQQARLSNITATDVFTSNGVIHVVDKVLLPKTLMLP